MSRCRVMVVDDNAVDRERVRRELRALARTTGVDIEVTECEDGMHALAVLQDTEARPDLVVTDLSMPGFATGYQVRDVALRLGVACEVMSGLPPLAPIWAARTRSKDDLGWLRQAVVHAGKREAPPAEAGPLRRALMGAGGVWVGVFIVAAISGWM